MSTPPWPCATRSGRFARRSWIRGRLPRCLVPMRCVGQKTCLRISSAADGPTGDSAAIGRCYEGEQRSVGAASDLQRSTSSSSRPVVQSGRLASRTRRGSHANPPALHGWEARRRWPGRGGRSWRSVGSPARRRGGSDAPPWSAASVWVMVELVTENSGSWVAEPEGSRRPPLPCRRRRASRRRSSPVQT